MKTFQVHDEDLDEFISIYRNKFGKDIERQEALDSAIKLLTLTNICLEGMFGDEYQLTGHSFQIDGKEYIQAKVPRKQYIESLTKKMKEVYNWDVNQVKYFIDDLKKMDEYNNSCEGIISRIMSQKDSG